MRRTCKRPRRFVRLVVIATLASTAPLLERAEAQQDLVDVLLKDPYLQQIDHALLAWNAGELVFEKKDLESAFFAAVDRRVSAPVHDFERTAEYAGLMKERWEKLPATLKEEYQLSPGARLMLLGAAYDKREGLNQFLAGNPQTFLEKLGMEMYVTLASSQMIAKEAQKSEIDSLAVIGTFSDFQSLIYPFCCWKSYR